MGSSGMKRKGRKRLPKVHEPRRTPTLAGNMRTWFLRRPEDVTIGGVGGPQSSSTPNPLFPYWLRWAGFAVIVASIRYFARRARRN